MTDNLYEAPKSDLSIVDEQGPKTEFYVVSPKKFIALYISTIGMYQLYWFYKNWALYRSMSGEKLWPIPRAIFSYFFVTSLFSRVFNRLSGEIAPKKWNYEAHATGLAMLIFISQALDRAANKSFGSPYTDVLSLTIMIPLFFLFYKAQQMINLACNDPDGKTNNVLTPINYFWIVLGIAMWLLIVADLFMPT